MERRSVDRASRGGRELAAVIRNVLYSENVVTTDQKGAIAETAIVHRAVLRGIGVLRPLNEAERYDLVFDLKPGLVRVQCKWASLDGDVISVRCCSSRRTATGTT